MPPCDAIRTLDAHDIARRLPASTQTQLGSAEEPVHDVVRWTKAVIHQLPISLRPNHEKRRQFALPDARRKLDVDLRAVVEGK